MSKFLSSKIKPLDPLTTTSSTALLEALEGCAFQGRNLGTALRVMNKMYNDPDCLQVLTLAGALVPAGMGLIIERLIECGFVTGLVSTGANLSHDLVNSVLDQGHYSGFVDADDDALYQERINRIYDVFLPEQNYISAEDFLKKIIVEIVDEEYKGKKEIIMTPSRLFHLVGKKLGEKGKTGLMVTAAKHNVPIFCGATSDSEFALDLAKYRITEGIKIILDEIGDVQAFGEFVKTRKKRGTLILGGGVPRNWAQQIFPYLDQLKLKDDHNYHGYDYGIRVCPEPVHWGGLSGCTFSESKSWGKYGPDATMCEVASEATIALPLLATAFLEGLKKK